MITLSRGSACWSDRWRSIFAAAWTAGRPWCRWRYVLILSPACLRVSLPLESERMSPNPIPILRHGIGTRCACRSIIQACRSSDRCLLDQYMQTTLASVDDQVTSPVYEGKGRVPPHDPRMRQLAVFNNWLERDFTGVDQVAHPGQHLLADAGQLNLGLDRGDRIADWNLKADGQSGLLASALSDLLQCRAAYHRLQHHADQIKATSAAQLGKRKSGSRSRWITQQFSLVSVQRRTRPTDRDRWSTAGRC